ncbi:hypothetical protein ACEPAI_6655 [Sanghuangporus weigelae]
MLLHYQPDIENVDVDEAIKVVNDILDRIAANPALEFGPEGMPEDIRTLLMTLEELPTPPMGNPLNRTANYPLSKQEVPSGQTLIHEPQAVDPSVSQSSTAHCCDGAANHIHFKRTDELAPSGSKELKQGYGAFAPMKSSLHDVAADENSHVAWTGHPSLVWSKFHDNGYFIRNDMNLVSLPSHGESHLPDFCSAAPDSTLSITPYQTALQQPTSQSLPDIALMESNPTQVRERRNTLGCTGLPFSPSLNASGNKATEISSSSLLDSSSSVSSQPNLAMPLSGDSWRDGAYNNTAWNNKARARTISPSVNIRNRTFFALPDDDDPSRVSLSPRFGYRPSPSSSADISPMREPFRTARHVIVKHAHDVQGSLVGPERRNRKERKTKVGNAFGSGTGIRCRLPSCNVPDYEFASRKELERHQDSAAVHCGSRARCPKCEKEYSRDDAVLRHMKRAHQSIAIDVEA